VTCAHTHIYHHVDGRSGQDIIASTRARIPIRMKQHTMSKTL
jgi:hypothetical protein